MNLDDQQALTAPFPLAELDWRLGSLKNGRYLALPYVDARAIQNRLDNVVGLMNWQDTYQIHPDGILCTLSIRFDSDPTWVSKMNGSPETHIESFKGGISKAFIRAAVNWGIGRYLYDVGELYARPCSAETVGCKKDKRLIWIPPELPIEFLNNEDAEQRFKLKLISEVTNKLIVLHSKKEYESATDFISKELGRPFKGNDIPSLILKDFEKVDNILDNFST